MWRHLALLPVNAAKDVYLRRHLGGKRLGQGVPMDDLLGGELLNKLFVQGQVREPPVLGHLGCDRVEGLGFRV